MKSFLPIVISLIVSGGLAAAAEAPVDQAAKSNYWLQLDPNGQVRALPTKEQSSSENDVAPIYFKGANSATGLNAHIGVLSDSVIAIPLTTVGNTRLELVGGASTPILLNDQRNALPGWCRQFEANPMLSKISGECQNDLARTATTGLALSNGQLRVGLGYAQQTSQQVSPISLRSAGLLYTQPLWPSLGGVKQQSRAWLLESQWQAGANTSLGLAAAVGTVQIQAPLFFDPAYLQTSAVTFTVSKGAFSGVIAGHSLKSTNPLHAGSNAVGVDLGFAWRMPWHAELFVGAENLLKQGEAPLLLPNPPGESRTSVNFSRTPYVRYKQEF